jgi:hypothetical protein
VLVTHQEATGMLVERKAEAANSSTRGVLSEEEVGFPLDRRRLRLGSSGVYMTAKDLQVQKKALSVLSLHIWRRKQRAGETF